MLKGGVREREKRSDIPGKLFFLQSDRTPGWSSDSVSRTFGSSCSAVLRLTRLLLGQRCLCFLFQFAPVFKESKLLDVVWHVLQRWLALSYGRS